MTTSARRAAMLAALLFSAPAAAQLVPRGAGQSCQVAVAFEHLAVRSVIGVTNYYHAVVVIGGARGVAFEGNPSGAFPEWGTLVGRRRNLASRPLKPESAVHEAGLVPGSCAQVVEKAAEISTSVGNARLPYAPAPELAWNSVNSNSFAHYLVRRLGLLPPPPPVPITSGWVPGYHEAIRD